MTRSGNTASGQTTANSNKEVISYNKDKKRIEQEQELKERAKNLLKTKQTEALTILSQQIVGVGRGDYMQVTIDGYTTKGLLNPYAYITINKKPTSEGLEFLDNFSEDALRTNLENIYKTIGTPTAKLLDILIYKLVQKGNSDKNNAVASITIKEYATILNDGKEPTRSQINNAREKIKIGMDALKYITYTYQKRGKLDQSHFNISLYGGTDGIYNGKAFFRFNPDFIGLSLLVKGCINVVPMSILSINEKQRPHAYLMAKKLLSLKRINRHNQHRATTFKVKTLLDYVVSLPRYRDKNGKIVCRQPKQKIIEPFEDNLRAIEDTGLLTWNYDKEYIDKLADADYTPTFEDFENATIVVTWNAEFEEIETKLIEGDTK